MTSKRISELAAAATLTGAEVVPVVQGGVTKRATADEIAGLVSIPPGTFADNPTPGTPKTAVVTAGNQTVAGTKTFSGKVENTGGYPRIDVFGSLDGSVDCTAAILAAVTQVKASGGGGVIRFYDTCLCSAQLNLQNVNGVKLEGIGGVSSLQKSRLRFIGASGSFIDGTGSHGLEIEDLRIDYTDVDYAGDLIDINGDLGADATNFNMRRCWVGGQPDGVGHGKLARSLVRLNRVITSNISDCQFIWAEVHIRQGDSQYVIGLSLERNIHNYSSDVHILAAADESTSIRGCTFEPGATGESSAYRHSVANFSVGLLMEGNWFGDAIDTPGAVWCDIRALGFMFIGNRMLTPNTALKLTACQGATIMGNQIGGTTAIDFASTCYEVYVHGNDFGSCVTTYENATNITSGSELQVGGGASPHRAGLIAFRGEAGGYSSTLDRVIMGRVNAMPSSAVANIVGLIDGVADGLHLVARSDYPNPEIGLWAGAPPVQRLRVAYNAVEVLTHDLSVLTIGKGLVAKSPDGTLYRLTPPNLGGPAVWVAV